MKFRFIGALKSAPNPAIAIILGMSFPAISVAQTQGVDTQIVKLPNNAKIDENSVDLASGIPRVAIQDVLIGGEKPLVNQFTSSNDQFPPASTGYSNYTSGRCGAPRGCPSFHPDNLIPALAGGVVAAKDADGYGQVLRFSAGDEVGLFDGSRAQGLDYNPFSVDQSAAGIGYIFNPRILNGSQLRLEAGNRLIFTSARGVVYETYFARTHDLDGYPLHKYVLGKIVYPSGLEILINYTANIMLSGRMDVSSIVRNDGYGLKYEYGNGSLRKVTAFNAAYDGCASVASQCATSFNWPTAQYAWVGDPIGGVSDKVLNVIHPGGETEVFKLEFRNRLIEHTSRSGAKRRFTYCQIGLSGHTENCENMGTGTPTSAYTEDGRVAYVQNNNSIYSYKKGSDLSGTYYDSVDGYHRPQVSFMVNYLNYQQALGVRYTKARDGRGCFFEDNETNNLTNCVIDGIRTLYTYDTRGNITSVRINPRDGSAPQIVNRTFPTACSNRVTCNQPNSVTDPRGNTIEFSYDPVHGGLLKRISAPDASGIRPEVRYEYVQRYPWLKSSGGGYSPSVKPIWVLGREEYCRSSSAVSGSCAAGVNDKVVVEYDYGPNSGPNNLHVRGIATTADNGAGQLVTLRTCFSYDVRGNKVSETRPNGNLASCP